MFERYLSRLNPKLDELWQSPRGMFGDSDGVWYHNIALSKDLLGTMMSEISGIAGLSKRYTNHCLRTSATCILDRAGFEARHIMKVSGHQSEASMSSYVHELDDEKYRGMSLAFCQASLGNVSPPDVSVPLSVSRPPGTVPPSGYGPGPSASLSVPPSGYGPGPSASLSAAIWIWPRPLCVAVSAPIWVWPLCGRTSAPATP